ncbi:hypothetical protein C8R47DRAFT_1061470 [Mycena vitilis]|nr:hypothetical protein C8R47DRAFT_1061470 [Mycena vitilis]
MRRASHLWQAELFWCENYNHIWSHGFQLRSRFDPTTKKPLVGEDSIPNRLSKGATNGWRRDNKLPVVLKKVKLEELEILKHLLALPQSYENRTIPLLDHFPAENDEDYFIIVMPMCGKIDEAPDFTHLGDMLRAFHQLATGLSFMHKHRIAHRDACAGNFVEDRSQLVPSGQHFAEPQLRPDGARRIKPLKRSVVRPEYYIIDFEFSLIDPSPSQCFGDVGQERNIPEDEADSYDPFMRDVFQFGCMIRARFLERYEGLVEPLSPIVASMTQRSPSDRPSAADVVDQLWQLVVAYPVGPKICRKNASFWTKQRVKVLNRLQKLLREK